MVGGRVLALQGKVAEPGYEIDALDGPVLEFQLLRRLLGASLPKGPAEVQGTRRIDFTNEKTGIQFATPSAEGYIPAPWHVRGQVRSTAGGVFEYELTLSYTAKQKPSDKGTKQEAVFSGELSKTANAKIDDQMSLEGWNVLGLGVQTKKDGGTTTYDYGAGPAKSEYRTVADIRNELAKAAYIGEADPVKDFTGFWKGKCEDPFGVRIMHYGTDGKYSIVFCGPGGCGKPDERLTFITKDPNFKVVNEDEIQESIGDGWQTYHRCTKDTHPVLKYEEDCEEAKSASPTDASQLAKRSRANGAEWELVRSLSTESGPIHLVLVADIKQRDREYYKQIGELLCPPRTKCSVNFWTDRDHIPDSEWMPVADLAVMTASFTPDPCEKKSALHLACWLYPTKAAGEADNCEYEPGAKVPPEK